VNQFGCPQTKGDSDGDGVTDDMDRCPDTPRGARVDEEGCPIDSDKDQVSDYKDKCPKTPDGCIVDEHGCPVDGDSDGVCDGVDQCPNTPDGVEVKADGCPKAKKLKKGESIRVKVYFETAKWDITPQGARDLQEAYRILKAYPKMMVLVEGHTDSKGTDEYNRELSIKRAKSIKTWLVTQGVASDRLETIGFGETRPVDTNETSDGRANNRRIEFRCTEGCAEEVEVE
jgi:OOP family OmpA-OmpF porin